MPAGGIWPAVPGAADPPPDPPTVPFPAVGSGRVADGRSPVAGEGADGPWLGGGRPGGAPPGEGRSGGPWPGDGLPGAPWPGGGRPGPRRPGPTGGGRPEPAPAPPEAATPGARGRLAGLVPEAWRGARLDPGRPGAAALALVAALAAVAAAVGVWWDRPQAEPVAALPAVVVPEAVDPGPGSTVTPGPAPAPAVLVVSVSGRVARPGLVELPEGSRVADALEAAGGALPDTDLSALNLARRLTDGEQVAVGVPAAPDAAGGPVGATPPDGGEAAPTGGPVDLNIATEADLDALPGVGPVTAQRILDWRAANGRFTRVEQLREVEGIGERRFAQLRELVVVR